MSGKEEQQGVDGAAAELAELASLREQVAMLAQVILDLDLRGTEDGGACEVAGIRLQQLVADKAVLQAQLDSATAKLGQERGKVKAMKADLPPKPRRFKGPDGERPGNAELLAAIDDAERLEIVFFGARQTELQGVEPVLLAGGKLAFTTAGERLRLRVPSLQVTSPVLQELTGYALLVDGETIAVAPRPDRLALTPATTFELKDDVIF